MIQIYVIFHIRLLQTEFFVRIATKLIFSIPRSPLHCCIAERNEALLDLLLESERCNVDLRTKDGDTALCMALLAKPSFESGAAKLLARGASPNSRYPGDEADTLLHRLARESREEAALFLLEPCDADQTKSQYIFNLFNDTSVTKYYTLTSSENPFRD